MLSNTKSPHIFYGWWVVGACFVMALYTAGIIGYSFTAFIEPIASEFGWSYTNISFASSLRGVEAGLFAPIVGYLVDRFGARSVMFIGGILTGIGVLALGRVSSLPMFYAAFSLIAIGLSALSNTAMLAPVVEWFRRNSSLAMGIMISGWGFSGFMVPIVVRLIDSVGWRQTLYILGIGVFIVVLPLSLVVRRPTGKDIEEFGSETGNTQGHHKVTFNSADNEFSIRQALRSRIFWYIALVFMAQHLVSNAVITHVMPYLSSVGVARSVASLAATGVPVASILGRFGFGWLGDRLNKKWLTVAGFAMFFIGLIIFSYLNPSLLFLLIFFDVFFGTGFGGTNTMRAVLARDAFGTKNFATILGFVTGVGTLGSLIGAPLAGFVYDTLGTYRPVWIGFAGIALLSLLTIATMPPAVTGKKKAVSAEPEKAGSHAGGD